MKRQHATQLLQELLTRATSDDTWPTNLVRSVHVFGSYARGALNPSDVDVAIDFERDVRWAHHLVNSLSASRDPFTILRMALRGRRRGLELLFERNSGGYDDIPMTLIWERGESLTVALNRLIAIPEDPDATRAPREAMIPCFEGLEDHLPLFVRESFIELVNDGTISIEQITLPDVEIDDPEIHSQINWRWKEGSPLKRAAHAVLGHLESRGVDLHAVHLHGEDLDETATPYYAAFQLRYVRALPWCFTEHGGIEWIEVPKPTRSKPTIALRVQLLDRDKMTRHVEDHHSLFR